MEKTKKPTKKDYFTALLAMPEVQANADIVKFINHELELLAKKNSADKKPTATQVANEAYKTAIYNHMENDPNRLFTVSELMKEVPEIAELANQKVSALVRQLKDEGLVKRTEDKRKAYFQIVE